MPDFDDKDLIIFATMILGIIAMFCLDSAENIVGNIITGMFGIAVGTKLSK